MSDIRNAVQLLQDTNNARGPYAVEALRATVSSLLATVSTTQQFIEYNRHDPDFVNLAYSHELIEAMEAVA